MGNEVKKLEELQARIANLRADAEAKRAAAQRASREYLKKKCEASIAQLEACIPKKPPNPWVMFRTEATVSGAASSFQQSKEIAERWANISPEEKKKYTDRYEAANKKFAEWSTSEEGRRNLQERNELLRQCRAASAEELGKAIAAADSIQTDEAPKHTPTKRAKDMQEEETPTRARLVKQRRAAPAHVPPPTKDP